MKKAIKFLAAGLVSSAMFSACAAPQVRSVTSYAWVNGTYYLAYWEGIAGKDGMTAVKRCERTDSNSLACYQDEAVTKALNTKK